MHSANFKKNPGADINLQTKRAIFASKSWYSEAIYLKNNRVFQNVHKSHQLEPHKPHCLKFFFTPRAPLQPLEKTFLRAAHRFSLSEKKGKP